MALINKLLSELNTWNLSEKTEISKYLLISLYYISNDEIKEVIKDFVTNIEYKSLEDNYAQIDFQLFLLIQGFIDIEKLPNLIKEIDSEVSKYRDGKSMSGSLYSLKSKLKYP